MITFIPKHKCTCGYEMDATSQYGGDAKPSEGDVSICFKCSRLWVFNADLTLRKLKATELESFANDPEIAKALEALAGVIQSRV